MEKPKTATASANHPTESPDTSTLAVCGQSGVLLNHRSILVNGLTAALDTRIRQAVLYTSDALPQ